ncbi:4Fe-4S binding protein [Rhodocytophaga rosea]|uniref:4Fe-4S binding protein n=1 Tax=Rhodocytophaga rosea TaxID=2704465 RepID=A0A6C0GMN2_9BACT|nr:4Fe-4S dicluster domain-containing protein [Rhodocytophaga rosea]QHT68862.1 4Fe-4S binding protein [Rhodocytophaga rosea]
MQAFAEQENKETFRNHLSTVDETGKRVWVYPKKPKGNWHQARVIVAIILLTCLFGIPFIQVDGLPFFLCNIFERKFVLFGYPFFPQDFYLFGLAMITFFVFIILFTVVFGRVWCGWACPQTIFMEMVFRKIEYWIEGDANQQKILDKAPWTADKLFKKSAKHLIFLLISVLIAHTLMAYIIGLEEVKLIVTQSPAENPAGFVGLVAFTGIFYLVFARLREQACTVVCPYGRLQGVLLTRESIVVAYDFVRGEPRGKKKKAGKEVKQIPTEDVHADCSGKCTGCTLQHTAVEKIGTLADIASVTERPMQLQDLMKQGDCIDCKLCVQVCPTGIDIRNGTQLECINCTACMDACDEVMEKIGKPKGLIRFDSHKGITDKVKLKFTPRIAAYAAVLMLLIGLQGFMITTRSQMEATFLRVPGMLYQEQAENKISNLYNVQLVNKTNHAMPVTLKLLGDHLGDIKVVGKQIMIPESASAEVVCFIELPKSEIHSVKTTLEIGIYSNGTLLKRIKTSFVGPVQ